MQRMPKWDRTEAGLEERPATGEEEERAQAVRQPDVQEMDATTRLAMKRPLEVSAEEADAEQLARTEQQFIGELQVEQQLLEAAALEDFEEKVVGEHAEGQRVQESGASVAGSVSGL